MIEPEFAVLGVSYDRDVLVLGVDGPSDIGRHPEALEDARLAGEATLREALRRLPD